MLKGQKSLRERERERERERAREREREREPGQRWRRLSCRHRRKSKRKRKKKNGGKRRKKKKKRKYLGRDGGALLVATVSVLPPQLFRQQIGQFRFTLICLVQFSLVQFSLVQVSFTLICLVQFSLVQFSLGQFSFTLICLVQFSLVQFHCVLTLVSLFPPSSRSCFQSEFRHYSKLKFEIHFFFLLDCLKFPFLCSAAATVQGSNGFSLILGLVESSVQFRSRVQADLDADADFAMQMRKLN